MASEIVALPGFSEFLERDVDRAGAKDLSGKEYNAVRIRKDYPGTYNAVTRALFFYKLPVKTCADLFRMNSQCVAAIRDQVIAASSTDGAAAFLVNSRRQSQRDIVLARLTEAISEKLSDEDEVAEMSVADLTSLLERLEKSPAARNGTDVRKDEATRTDVTILDASAFDDVLNGLSTEKKFSSSTISTSLAGNVSDGNCSTRNEYCMRNSFEMSNRKPIDECLAMDSIGNSNILNSLCNSLCNYGKTESEINETGSNKELKPPVRGGGEPRAAGAGGLTNNASEETQGGL